MYYLQGELNSYLIFALTYTSKFTAHHIFDRKVLKVTSYVPK